MIWFISGLFCGVGLTVIVMSMLIKSKECENELTIDLNGGNKSC